MAHGNSWGAAYNPSAASRRAADYPRSGRVRPLTVSYAPQQEAPGPTILWERQSQLGRQMSDISREEIDAKLDAAEARTDVKFAQLMGELGKINVRLDGVERSTSGTKATIIGTGIAAVALVVGILAFGQQWFGIGLTTRDIVRATITEMQTQAPKAGEK